MKARLVARITPLSVVLVLCTVLFLLVALVGYR